MPAEPILSCSHVVEPGGAERVLQDLLATLDRQRFAPHLAAPGDGPLVEQARALQVPVHDIPMAAGSPVGKAMAALRTAPRLRRLAAELDCRLLVANSMIAGYAAVRAQHAGLACIWHLHIVTSSRIARLAIRRAAAVLAPSRAAIDAIGGHPAGEVVPNGVPDRYFAACGDGIRQRIGVAADAGLIGIVGRVDPDKGHDWLLRSLAASRSRPAPHLVVAGAELFLSARPRNAGQAERLRRLCAELDLTERVHWLGQLDDTAPLLAEIDVLAVPSTAPEGAPRTIAEAQAAGCPVIASGVGGVPELIADGATGILVQPDDPGSLVHAIDDLLASRSRRRQIADRAREHAEASYRMATFARRCERVYARVLAGGGRRSGQPGPGSGN